MSKILKILLTILFIFMPLYISDSSDLRMQSPWKKSGTTIYPYSLLDYVGIGVIPTFPLHVSTTDIGTSAKISSVRSSSMNFAPITFNVTDNATSTTGWQMLNASGTWGTTASLTAAGAFIQGAAYNLTLRGSTTVVANQVIGQNNVVNWNPGNGNTASFDSVIGLQTFIGTSGGTTGTVNLSEMVGLATGTDLASGGAVNWNITGGVYGIQVSDNSGVFPGVGVINRNVGIMVNKQGAASAAFAATQAGIWLAGDGLGADITFGAALNAKAYYDSTNLVINPKVVGTGYVDIQGYFVTEGDKRVSTQFDKINATLANITGLSVNVTAGKTYKFETRLFVDADVTGGSKYAISGTATATNIIYHVKLVDDTTSTNTITSRQTVIGGAGVGQAGTTVGFCEISGIITVNAGGTLTVQFAQNVANGTSSVLVGSSFIVREIL